MLEIDSHLLSVSLKHQVVTWGSLSTQYAVHRFPSYLPTQRITDRIFNGKYRYLALAWKPGCGIQTSFPMGYKLLDAGSPVTYCTDYTKQTDALHCELAMSVQILECPRFTVENPQSSSTNFLWDRSNEVRKPKGPFFFFFLFSFFFFFLNYNMFIYILLL